MPIPTPFHPRTFALCDSLFYKEWAGYYTVKSFDTCHEREYYAVRHAAGLFDVTALFKYEVTGPGAAEFLSRVMVKDIRKLRIGRVTYLCWCDDDGKVLDDGTVTRLGDDQYRVTAAEPSLAWLRARSRGYDVDILDSSTEIGALALQGPKSRDILRAAGATAIDGLRFFGHMKASVAGADIDITRTGYTGDLGYELWIENDAALAVWDELMRAGRPYRILPAGLDALDVTRVEAGFIMNGVDYFSSNHCFIESRKSTPYELGLGWAVQLDREPFIGQRALAAERAAGSQWATVGLVYDWVEYEALFRDIGLPPQTPAGAWRTAVPVYDGDRQVGQATSGAWSPILKKLLAIASVKTPYAALGSKLSIEVTAEYERRTVPAVVSATPFYNPPRKRKP